MTQSLNEQIAEKLIGQYRRKDLKGGPDYFYARNFDVFVKAVTQALAKARQEGVEALEVLLDGVEVYRREAGEVRGHKFPDGWYVRDLKTKNLYEGDTLTEALTARSAAQSLNQKV